MNPDHCSILACADLHGQAFQKVSDVLDEARPDWIILCGDILPDFKAVPWRESRLKALGEFWTAHRSAFLRKGATTTLVRGNHEIEGFEDPAMAILPAGLERQVVRLEGNPVEFGAYGFSREWEEEDLEEELQGQLRQAPAPGIYLSHVPPLGCLDRNGSGRSIGHRPLASHLAERQWPEALVLCGHVHAGFGSMTCGETLIVNVACGYALVEWTFGTPVLLHQERLF